MSSESIIENDDCVLFRKIQSSDGGRSNVNISLFRVECSENDNSCSEIENHISTACTNCGISPSAFSFADKEKMLSVGSPCKALFIKDDCQINTDNFLSLAKDTEVTLIIDTSITAYTSKFCKYFLSEKDVDTQKFVFLISTGNAYRQEWIDFLGDALKKMFVLDDELTDRIKTVAYELLMNAILHGNMAVDFPVDRNSADFFKAFEKVEKMIEKESISGKSIAIVVEINSNDIYLSVEDEGSGFNFNHFVEKYEKQAFTKGMDYVLHMADEIINAPEKGKITVRFSAHSAQKSLPPTKTMPPIAVLSQSRVLFDIMKTNLQELGYMNVHHIHDFASEIEGIYEKCGALIILSDIDYKSLSPDLEKFRTKCKRQQFPILFQTNYDKKKEPPASLFDNVNEIIKTPLNLYELGSRLSMQIEMTNVRNNLFEKFVFYKNEMDTTLPILEKHESVTICEDILLGTRIFNLCSKTGIAEYDMDKTETKAGISGSWYFSSICLCNKVNDEHKVIVGVGINGKGFMPVLLMTELRHRISTIIKPELRKDLANLSQIIDNEITLMLPEGIRHKKFILEATSGKSGNKIKNITFFGKNDFQMFSLTFPESSEAYIKKLQTSTDFIAIPEDMTYQGKKILLFTPNPYVTESVIKIDETDCSNPSDTKELYEAVRKKLNIPMLILEVENEHYRT